MRNHEAGARHPTAAPVRPAAAPAPAPAAAPAPAKAPAPAAAPAPATRPRHRPPPAAAAPAAAKPHGAAHPRSRPPSSTRSSCSSASGSARGRRWPRPMTGPEHAIKASAEAKLEVDNFWQSFSYEEKKSKDHPGLKVKGLWGFDQGSKRFVRAAIGNHGEWDTASAPGLGRGQADLDRRAVGADGAHPVPPHLHQEERQGVDARPRGPRTGRQVGPDRGSDLQEVAACRFASGR